MTDEQRTNADKLEQVRSELWKIADLFNKAGYKASPYELSLIDQITDLAQSCQKLARQ